MALTGAPTFAILAGGLCVVAVLIIVWLRFGARPPPVPPPKLEILPTEVELAQLLAAAGGEQGTIRIVGSLRVSGQTTLPPGFVVEGSLAVAANAQLDALVEVRGNATLEDGARVSRALIVRGDLTLGPDTRLAGAQVAGDVHMYPGSAVESILDCGTLYLYQEKESLALELEEVAVGEETSDRAH